MDILQNELEKLDYNYYVEAYVYGLCKSETLGSYNIIVVG